MPSGFNRGDFERKLKKQINDSAMDHLRKKKAALTRLPSTQKGRPLPDIKRAIRKVHDDVTEPQLTEWAEHIQAGKPITVTSPLKVL